MVKWSLQTKILCDSSTHHLFEALKTFDGVKKLTIRHIDEMKTLTIDGYTFVDNCHALALHCPMRIKLLWHNSMGTSFVKSTVCPCSDRSCSVDQKNIAWSNFINSMRLVSWRKGDEIEMLCMHSRPLRYEFVQLSQCHHLLSLSLSLSLDPMYTYQCHCNWEQHASLTFFTTPTCRHFPAHFTVP